MADEGEQSFYCSSSWDEEDDHDMDQALQQYLQTMVKSPAKEPSAAPMQPACAQQNPCTQDTALAVPCKVQAQTATSLVALAQQQIDNAQSLAALVQQQNPDAQSLVTLVQQQSRNAQSLLALVAAQATEPSLAHTNASRSPPPATDGSPAAMVQQRRLLNSRLSQSVDTSQQVELCTSSSPGFSHSPFSSQTQLSTLNSPQASHAPVMLLANSPLNRSSNALQPTLRKQVLSKSERFAAHLYQDVAGMPLGFCSSEPGSVPMALQTPKPPEGPAPTRPGRATHSGGTSDNSPRTSIDDRSSLGKRRTSVLLPQLAAQLEDRTSQPSYVAISVRASLVETSTPRYARGTESSGRMLLKVESSTSLRASVSGKLSTRSSATGALVAAISAGLTKPSLSVTPPGAHAPGGIPV